MSAGSLKGNISRLIFPPSKSTFPKLFNFIFVALLNFIVRLSFSLSQKKLIEQEEWDYLIILDGCSYDYFRMLNSIPGKLSCVISPASGTGFWAMRTWTRPYNAIYISANPQINSMGYVPVRGVGLMKLINPSNFIKIINAWLEGCVPPERMNSYVISNLPAHMIIHYLQPHAPFIGDVKLPVAGTERVRKWLARNNLGAEYYREAYMSNLKRVLRAVKSLLPYLEGKIVITADHGYWDGSKDKFEHGGFSTYLHKVPWFEVSNEFTPKKANKEKQKTNPIFALKEKEEIRRRLESLGYL
jgi:hypothetical protein